MPARCVPSRTPPAPTWNGSAPIASEQDRKLIEFIRDSEVLILDSQYTADEYQRHIGWGHSCAEDTVAFALQGQRQAPLHVPP